MPSYVILLNWTDQGIRAFRDTLQRAQDFGALAERFGSRIKDLYWTLGPYDLVSLVEAPDDETATALALALSALGNVRTTTLRAYDREEMHAIIDKVS
ncbi:GYD family protein [Carbonactinospora thermoautotrophica]|uniref:GYD family protein n=1 Tax=Carbonactinospora thermoautotrophica TaxID=1469144 RepID=A0A132MUA3_9ACTN|nr:GYD domain-containing protein [Carbonactinospora thermoautotrophica]KWX01419.1 GYD family protein [Carbonactinospora thermoautotrophica]KWX05657.1 GYD family protein [Carbonactinospora thermoautotrophica]KWX07286.1 GYD family protein [Carbonactinospora thermoautotrophica]